MHLILILLLSFAFVKFFYLAILRDYFLEQG